jgi:hypothetical protein
VIRLTGLNPHVTSIHDAPQQQRIYGEIVFCFTPLTCNHRKRFKESLLRPKYQLTRRQSKTLLCRDSSFLRPSGFSSVFVHEVVMSFFLLIGSVSSMVLGVILRKHQLCASSPSIPLFRCQKFTVPLPVMAGHIF